MTSCAPDARARSETRMSSSLGSMPGFHFFEDEPTECNVDARIHRQYPVVFAREARAFYRILLGHDDRVDVPELEVGLRVGMMIRKCVRCEAHPQPLQMIEKARRIADAGDGVYPLAVEYAGFLMEGRVQQIVKQVSVERHCECFCARAG